MSNDDNVIIFSQRIFLKNGDDGDVDVFNIMFTYLFFILFLHN